MDPEKLAKLPAWARDHIKTLQARNAPAAEEIAQLRKKVEHLNGILRKRDTQVEAMVQMFQCAAKGGNEVAAAVERIVEDFLTSDEV